MREFCGENLIFYTFLFVKEQNFYRGLIVNVMNSVGFCFIYVNNGAQRNMDDDIKKIVTYE